MKYRISSILLAFSFLFVMNAQEANAQRNKKRTKKQVRPLQKGFLKMQKPKEYKVK